MLNLFHLIFGHGKRGDLKVGLLPEKIVHKRSEKKGKKGRNNGVREAGRITERKECRKERENGGIGDLMTEGKKEGRKKETEK